MPKLLIFAPCEKLILSQENVASLISVMEAINVNVGADVPADAVLPIRWEVLTLWQRQPDDPVGTRYEQRLDVLRPDGVIVSNTISGFEIFEQATNYRNIASLFGLPIGQQGRCSIKLFLRVVNQDSEWGEIAEYSIAILHNPASTQPQATD